MVGWDHRLAIGDVRPAGTDPAPRRAGPTWREFPAAQAHAIIARDFMVVETVPLRRLSVLVLIEHGTRRLHLAGVTAHPTGAWAAPEGLRIITTLPKTPRMNAICEHA